MSAEGLRSLEEFLDAFSRGEVPDNSDIRVSEIQAHKQVTDATAGAQSAYEVPSEAPPSPLSQKLQESFDFLMQNPHFERLVYDIGEPLPSSATSSDEEGYLSTEATFAATSSSPNDGDGTSEHPKRKQGDDQPNATATSKRRRMFGSRPIDDGRHTPRSPDPAWSEPMSATSQSASITAVDTETDSFLPDPFAAVPTTSADYLAYLLGSGAVDSPTDASQLLGQSQDPTQLTTTAPTAHVPVAQPSMTHSHSFAQDATNSNSVQSFGGQAFTQAPSIHSGHVHPSVIQQAATVQQNASQAQFQVPTAQMVVPTAQSAMNPPNPAVHSQGAPVPPPNPPVPAFPPTQPSSWNYIRMKTSTNHGASVRYHAPVNTQPPYNVDITLGEIQAFFAHWLQIPEVMNRFMRNGLRGGDMAKMQLHAVGLLTKANVKTVTDRIKKHCTHAADKIYPVEKAQNGGRWNQSIAVAKGIQTDLTANQWQLRCKYNPRTVHKEDFGPVLLRDISSAVPLHLWPTGQDAGAVTQCLQYDLQNPHLNLSTNDWANLIQQRGFTTPAPVGANRDQEDMARFQARVLDPTV